MKPSKFGRLVKRVRRGRRMSQGDFAARWGVSQSFISQLESGRIRHIGSDKLEQFHVAFGLDLTDFFGGGRAKVTHATT